MLAAPYVDEVGFTVRRITSNGLLTVTPIEAGTTVRISAQPSPSNS